MSKIVWLASYPKSGNTWIRILLSNYIKDCDNPADINNLDSAPIASMRFWFDEWVGIEASALDDALIERLRPGVYRCLAGDSPDTLHMKVHDAWGRSDRGEALFPADVTAGVVYIIRNPLDIAVSWSHYYSISFERAVHDMCDPNLVVGRTGEKLMGQLRQKFRSWSCHVQSWVDESGLPCYVVRYEDLCSDPVAGFAGVVRFCGLAFNEDRVRKAVAFSDFSELRSQELTKGFREHNFRSNTAFFRRGRPGSWQDELPVDLANKLIRCHEQTMRRFGYIDGNGQPV